MNTSLPELDFAKLPRYRCHKIVKAAKIIDVSARPEGGCVLFLQPDERGIDGRCQFIVSQDFCPKHLRITAMIGGYFVVYEDGYTSFSPAKAFEEGYTRIPPRAEEPGIIAEPGSYDMSIHSNPDARAWAALFVKTLREVGRRIRKENNYPNDCYGIAEAAMDEGYMISWFANAMMAMHDSMTRKEGDLGLAQENATLRTQLESVKAAKDRQTREFNATIESLTSDADGKELVIQQMKDDANNAAIFYDRVRAERDDLKKDVANMKGNPIWHGQAPGDISQLKLTVTITALAARQLQSELRWLRNEVAVMSGKLEVLNIVDRLTRSAFPKTMNGCLQPPNALDAALDAIDGTDRPEQEA